MVVVTSMKTPRIDQLFAQQYREIERDHRRAAIAVTDEASKKAQRHVQAKMRSVGLGKLANAVGQTSTLRSRQTGQGRNPYGVLFARGGDESRAGQALESYAYGASITARRGKWLAYPTEAAPRFIRTGGRRRRLTPAMWETGGLDQRIGKLVFIQTSANVALLVVRGVSLSPKTGQAKALGKRAPRTRIAAKGNVPVFVLIRRTQRSQRFDHHQIMKFYADRIPDYLRRTLEGYNRTPG